MIKILRKIINSFLIKTINYRFVNNTEYTLQQNSIKTDSVLEKDFLEINEKINKIYKMNTLNETNYSAYQTVKNALSLKLKGSIVECGVYQGQKINYFLETLNILKINNIDIYIIDTFEGMTESSNKDIQMITKKVMKKNDLSASLESVKDRIYQTNYPKDKLHFIKMDVRNENDLRNAVKGDIIILRLDTDFYESTKSELNYLYPLLSEGGVLIIDDYGSWLGSKKATDEYFLKKKCWMHFIDHSARMIIK